MPAVENQSDANGAELSRVCPQAALHEEAYWRRQFSREHYYRPGLDFEDYAPAYCVGFVGSAQYGGDFGDARLSLCANWERIKCGSRLSLEDALPAMKAAWERRSLSPNGRSVASVASSMAV